MDSSMVLAQGPWRVVGRRRRNAQHGSGEYDQFMSLRSRCIPGVLVGDRLAQDSRDVEIRDIRDRLCRNPHWTRTSSQCQHRHAPGQPGRDARVDGSGWQEGNRRVGAKW